MFVILKHILNYIDCTFKYLVNNVYIKAIGVLKQLFVQKLSLAII